MKKLIIGAIFGIAMAGMLITGCQNGSTKNNTENNTTEETTQKCPLEDGVYNATFTTDSNMFHVNSELNGIGTLTVKDGKMTIHVTLEGKGILQLFLGSAEDAQKEGASLIDHTEDTVNYSDGTTDKAYGFDIPVPVLDEEYDLALIGSKGKWYDHKVKVSNPQLVEK